MEAYALSWEAASERLLDASALPAGTRRNCESLDSTASYWLHWCCGINDPVPIFDVFRSVTGAPPKIPWDERLRIGQKALQVAGEAVSDENHGVATVGQEGGDGSKKR